MRKRLIIIGAGGHGKVVADTALRMNRWKTVAFLDDNEAIRESLGLAVIGRSSNVSDFVGNSDIFVAIGNNGIREKFFSRLEKYKASLPSIIHPTAVIGEYVRIGYGSVIMAGAVVNSCTRIGKGCIVNTGTTVDHDNEIDDFVHLSPGVNTAGAVKIGKRTWLCIGSKVIQQITITDDCIIGAGAVVVSNIDQQGTYLGIPARRR